MTERENSIGNCLPSNTLQKLLNFEKVTLTVLVADAFLTFLVYKNSLPLPVGERGLELELVVVTLLLMKIRSLLLGCHSSLSNEEMLVFMSPPSCKVLVLE